MGRPSKLTDKQWEQLGQRLLAGESGRALAKEYKVSEAAIRARFSAQHAQIKSIANQIVATDSALKSLPISAQVAAQNLAEQLRSITGHLLGAANYGAATSHRLAGIAHAKVQEIDDAKPLDDKSLDSLRGVAALTKLANEASTIGVNLLVANKEALRELRERDAPKAQRVPVIVQDAGTDDTDTESEQADANA